MEYLNACRRQLKQLDPDVRRGIIAFMRENVAEAEDPYALAKELTGKWAGHWRYCVGTYRVICKIRNREFVVMAVKAGHRSDVYN